MGPKTAIVCGAGYVSGKEIVALELAGALRERGNQIYFIISSWNNGDFRQRLAAQGFDFQELPIGFISASLGFRPMRMTLEQLIQLPALWLGYRRFLRQVAPSRIIHTNWHHLLLLLPFLSKKRDLFWIHEIMPLKQRFQKLFERLDRTLCHFVAVSKAVANSLVGIGLTNERVAVIYNGLQFQPRSAASPASAAVRFAVIGQISPSKGHEWLIRAFSQVAHPGDNVELHIFGSGDSAFSERLKRLINQTGIERCVKWRGYLTNRNEIFSQIDVCVIPSILDDPLPTVAIEAAMAGLPCIASNRGGLPEIIDNGVTGLLADPQDPNTLRDALERLKRNAMLRFQMGLAARNRAQERFNRDRFAAEFAAVLEKC